ncbi:MAG: glutaredoxin 3 [Deltaproteobacteria bacterium]|nr:glutaredoxin 3 [Deltaproteobacteria bacterium]
MPDIKVYTTRYCAYCLRAKRLLDQKGLRFEEIDVGGSAERRAEVVRRSGRRTVPQIFIDGKPVGGFDEIKALDDRGELDALLGLA